MDALPHYPYPYPALPCPGQGKGKLLITPWGRGAGRAIPFTLPGVPLKENTPLQMGFLAENDDFLKEFFKIFQNFFTFLVI